MEGCPYYCPKCHYKTLKKKDKFSLLNIKNEITSRFINTNEAGLYDAVVISGGEPLMYEELPTIIRMLKNYGVGKIGLHTSGYNPKILEKSIYNISFVGIDFKTTDINYANFTGVKDSFLKFTESLSIIMNSNIDFEVRTTIHEDDFTEDDLMRMAEILQTFGITKWCWQRGRNEYRTYTCNRKIFDLWQHNVNTKYKNMIIYTR